MLHLAFGGLGGVGLCSCRAAYPSYRSDADGAHLLRLLGTLYNGPAGSSSGGRKKHQRQQPDARPVKLLPVERSVPGSRVEKMSAEDTLSLGDHPKFLCGVAVSVYQNSGEQGGCTTRCCPTSSPCLAEKGFCVVM